MDNMNVDELIEQAGNWLLNNRESASGGWGEHLGRSPSTLNTAEALIALLDSQCVKGSHNKVKAACAYLIGHRIDQGADRGAWPREVHDDNVLIERSVPDLVRTCFVLEALIKAALNMDEPAVADAIKWLVKLQMPDGGWGFRSGSPSEVLPTCLALSALLEAYECEFGPKEVLDRGLQCLVEQFATPEHSFAPHGRLLEAAHTIYAALVLQKARRCKLSRYSDEETAAVDWLLEHPGKARALVEETVEIDPLRDGCGKLPDHHGCADYGFTFTSDALLIRVLLGSRNESHRTSRLANDALLSLRDRIDRTGGISGHRVFSWSTAKGLNALAVVRHKQLEMLPSAKPEYTGPKAGGFILVLAVTLLGAMLYLTANDSFDFLQAAFLSFLMLATLLAYGHIGEKTFKELGQPLMQLFGRRRKSA